MEPSLHAAGRDVEASFPKPSCLSLFVATVVCFYGYFSLLSVKCLISELSYLCVYFQEEEFSNPQVAEQLAILGETKSLGQVTEEPAPPEIHGECSAALIERTCYGSSGFFFSLPS